MPRIPEYPFAFARHHYRTFSSECCIFLEVENEGEPLYLHGRRGFYGYCVPHYVLFKTAICRQTGIKLAHIHFRISITLSR